MDPGAKALQNFTRDFELLNKAAAKYPEHAEKIAKLQALIETRFEEGTTGAREFGEELDEMMQQYEQLAEEVFWNALSVSIKYNG